MILGETTTTTKITARTTRATARGKQPGSTNEQTETNTQSTDLNPTALVESTPTLVENTTPADPPLETSVATTSSSVIKPPSAIDTMTSHIDALLVTQPTMGQQIIDGIIAEVVSRVSRVSIISNESNHDIVGDATPKNPLSSSPNTDSQGAAQSPPPTESSSQPSQMAPMLSDNGQRNAETMRNHPSHLSQTSSTSSNELNNLFVSPSPQIQDTGKNDQSFSFATTDVRLRSTTTPSQTSIDTIVTSQPNTSTGTTTTNSPSEPMHTRQITAPNASMPPVSYVSIGAHHMAIRSSSPDNSEAASIVQTRFRTIRTCQHGMQRLEDRFAAGPLEVHAYEAQLKLLDTYRDRINHTRLELERDGHMTFPELSELEELVLDTDILHTNLSALIAGCLASTKPPQVQGQAQQHS